MYKTNYLKWVTLALFFAFLLFPLFVKSQYLTVHIADNGLVSYQSNTTLTELTFIGLDESVKNTLEEFSGQRLCEIHQDSLIKMLTKNEFITIIVAEGSLPDGTTAVRGGQTFIRNFKNDKQGVGVHFRKPRVFDHSRKTSG